MIHPVAQEHRKQGADTEDEGESGGLDWSLGHGTAQCGNEELRVLQECVRNLKSMASPSEEFHGSVYLKDQDCE